MLHRRTLLHLFACAVAQLAFQRVVRAQGYPDRPITLVVPFPAGGPTDVIARIFAERLRQALGQAAIVENVAGAGATIGVARVIGPGLTATRSPLAIRPAMSADLRSIPSRMTS